MSHNARFLILLGVSFFLAAAPTPGGAQYWNLPPLPSPEEYGNVLINRTSGKSGVKPATFSHWLHRQRHTCRVCHFELEFNMKANTTEITETANKQGRYCGSAGCHDGKAAFGHEQEHCSTCHNGNRAFGKEKFTLLSDFPTTKWGNGVNWTRALDKGLIKPAHYLSMKPPDEITYDKVLSLAAEWHNIPPAVFPHKHHVKWLDCNNCHPDIFNIKKKTTKHFEMVRILNGEFCGVCHLSVAFPMNDCKRCHPRMKE